MNEANNRDNFLKKVARALMMCDEYISIEYNARADHFEIGDEYDLEEFRLPEDEMPILTREEFTKVLEYCDKIRKAIDDI